MRVRVLSPAQGSAPPGPAPAVGPGGWPVGYGGWSPRCVLGADSPGRLLLPPARPTAAWLYAPRGVWTDGTRVVVTDTGNHRVLIWHRLPTSDGEPADVVLGQPDEHTEGPAAGGRGPANGLNLPTGVLVHGGRLLVADAWHHRVLVWDELPQTTDTPPDHVLGQPAAGQVEPNAGGEPTGASLYWPFGVAVVDGWFWVADTGNRRVLGWRDGIPLPGQSADVVLGQPNPFSRDENRGGEVAADSFRWPHAIVGTGRGGLLVADAGNHRVLRWDLRPDGDRPADAVLGQPDFEDGSEFPYVPQLGRFRFPYGLTAVGEQIAIADTANNRVLFHPATDQHDAAPTAVLAQPDAAAAGENRWEQVAADTLCWPYGLHWTRTPDGADLLAVADSGNNRIVLWQRRTEPAAEHR